MCNSCALSRRAFLGVVTGLPMVVGCAVEPATASSSEEGVSIGVSEVRIRLALVSELRTPGGWIVIREASLLVLHATPGAYRAFCNVCTHAGCGIQLFVEGHFRCQCHGSEFDTDGRAVAGPATEPLRRLALVHDAAAGELRVKRPTTEG